ncbi:tripartite tricarboxylate transporter substrate binding protein [Noviherbaspirillum sp. ST9]|uniref:tripartite tricarboxylate transporter substrate binding protein n=1 Tax=Noviherbaspirillum sp. ST9 TaxID=3401606 RepID=UPI003B587EE2
MKAFAKIFSTGVLMCAAFSAAANDNFPNRPIKWVVPFTPGGAMDSMARAIGERLAQNLGQPVVIENRPGAGGTIGSALVAKSEPDGHTMMIVSIGHAVNPALYPKLSYDPVKSFEPVSLVAIVPNVLVVGPGVKANNVSELIATAKAQPGKLTYASAGNGTTIHLGAELFNAMAGVDIMHVPYKGSAPAMTDLLGRQVDMMFDSVSSAKPHIDSGRLKALAVTTTKRSSVLPNVPTLNEAGLKGYELNGWYAVFVPAKTPRPVVDKLNAEIVKAIKHPDVAKRFSQLGAEPVGSTPEELAKYLGSEIPRWTEVIRSRNIKAD